MSKEFDAAMKQDINASERNRLLFVLAITTLLGWVIMPHDAPVATLAYKYIFPAVVSGICFGIAIMAGVMLWKGEKSTAQNKAGK